MALEIERKFLVKDDGYKQEAERCCRIAQGYICSTRGKTVRIRICDRKGFLTIKGPSEEGGLSRYEWEKEIALADAEDLLKICEPGMIDKTRYMVPAGKHWFEVDEFHGDNDGLVIAEVELSDENETFQRPSFLGEEVTGDVKYYNSYLAKHPYKDWRG